MDKIYTNDVKALFEAILSLKNVDECYKFFEDALTEREIIDIAQRLKAAKMLSAGKSYLDVGLETGMSTATISRVSKALDILVDLLQFAFAYVCGCVRIVKALYKTLDIRDIIRVSQKSQLIKILFCSFFVLIRCY